MNDAELTQQIIEVNIILADIIKSQFSQLESMHDLSDRIQELERERK